MEDKKKICEALYKALKYTREFEDLEKLEYEKHDRGLETVTVQFENGCIRRINVTMDSGTALIKDILRSIC